MRRLLVLLITIALLSSAALAQTRGSKRRGTATSSSRAAAASKVEPLRSIAGQLNGNTVNGDFEGRGRAVPFTFTFKRAEIVGDQVVVSGDLQIGGRLSQRLQSRLVATMATADNPWPSARDEEPKEKPKEKPKAQAGEQKQGREAKNPETAAQLGELSQATQDTARKTPSSPGERNEQTQSLYAQAAEGIGCGAFYFTIELPPQLRTAMGAGAQPLQMNVVLAPIDNPQGEQISRLICRAHRQAGDKSTADRTGNLEKLNRVLDSAR
ncbi:MAG TPA: hypothetical protein VKA60_14650 [Blastocatellia bacterium]|nr:hypothetical protein [Blastocatellia bacterium]